MEREAMQQKTNSSAAWGKRCFAIAAFVVGATLVSAQSAKLSKDLQSLPSQNQVNVIVQYYNAPGTADANAAASVGASNGKKLGLFKGSRYGMSPAAAAKLVAADTNVKYISADRPLRGAMNFAVPAVNADLALNLVYDGTGIGIAVIDSGVNSVAELSSGSCIVYSQNFDTGANSTSDVYG